MTFRYGAPQVDFQQFEAIPRVRIYQPVTGKILVTLLSKTVSNRIKRYYVYKELTWPISYPLLPIVPKDLPQPPGTSRGHAPHRAVNLYILSRERLAHPFSCCIFLLVLYAFEGL